MNKKVKMILGSSAIMASLLLAPASAEAVSFSDAQGPAIQYVYEHNIMTGISKNTFGSELNLTRGDFVYLLYRIQKTPVTSRAIFQDVPLDAYYAKAVTWGVDNGIIYGISPTQFSPKGTLTIEQTAAILERYNEKFLRDLFYAETPLPANIKVSDWARESVTRMQLYFTDISQPQSDIKRKEIAEVIYRIQPVKEDPFANWIRENPTDNSNWNQPVNIGNSNLNVPTPPQYEAKSQNGENFPLESYIWQKGEDNNPIENKQPERKPVVDKNGHDYTAVEASMKAYFKDEETFNRIIRMYPIERYSIEDGIPKAVGQYFAKSGERAHTIAKVKDMNKKSQELERFHEDAERLATPNKEQKIMLDKVNALRKANGLNELKYSALAQEIAEKRIPEAIDIKIKHGMKADPHRRYYNGPGAETIMVEFGYPNAKTKICENVTTAYYKKNNKKNRIIPYAPEKAYESLENSPGHKRNMLNPKNTHVGFAKYSKDGHTMWLQFFLQDPLAK